ncbi:hypothetical protein AB0C93_31195 [Streptomyces sp. NPDC048518]|uniref:hypothetical protein n=1 Tax=Streptomyces sp. NPDC048518 TaxID=3155029 RepID=UPI0033FB4EC9
MKEEELPVDGDETPADVHDTYDDGYEPPSGPVQIDDPLVAAGDEGPDPSQMLPLPVDR